MMMREDREGNRCLFMHFSTNVPPGAPLTVYRFGVKPSCFASSYVKSQSIALNCLG